MWTPLYNVHPGGNLKGFRVYVFSEADSPLFSIEQAKLKQYRINWFASAIEQVEPAQPVSINTVNGKEVKYCTGEVANMNWAGVTASGIGYLDVSIESCGFTETPTIQTSLHGASSHWLLSGTTKIYDLTAKKFRIWMKNARVEFNTQLTVAYRVFF